MTNFEQIQENKRHLRRLERQIDALTIWRDETNEHLDKLMAEKEQTDLALILLEMDRSPMIPAIEPLQMEFV